MFPAFKFSERELLDITQDRLLDGLFLDQARGRAPHDFTSLSLRKGLDAFATDGVGDAKDIAPALPLILTIDAQPSDISTSASLQVDGPRVISTLDALGDSDFFKVELEAGQYYDIGQFLVTGGPSGVPLADAYLELYDSSGALIVTADGGGANTPSGLDALLTFQATYTGTYYVNARAFDNGTPDGQEGDYVGDYEVFVESVDAADPTAYIPRYSPDSPLHSIDWGSQVDRTVRNPDGDNGPRDNGAADTGVVVNPTYGIVGKNVITYYFAKTGDVFLDEDPANPGLATMVAEGFQQWEKDAFRLALDQYEQVCDNVYLEVQTREQADFKFVTYEGTPGIGASLLGRMSPPNEANEGQAEFNAGDARWTEAGLQQGGFYFPTLLHEFGHGHGMAHPHDNGGRSSVMRGAGPSEDPVEGAIGGQLGDYGLSQQVHTIMSYNDGWQSSPYGMPRSGGITGTEVDHFGWVGTLSPLDIAVIQDKYGVNEEWATGDNVYTLKDVNAAGTFYATIWDAAGTDEIRYDGARDAYIDLRAATLEYEEGGGGWVSYAYGIHGGFTIANGAVIENATSGAGDDILIGNDSANVLNGGAGADAMSGGAGDDLYYVDAAADVTTEAAGEGVDTVSSVVTRTLGANIENLTLTGSAAINGTGNDLDNTLTGNGASNRLNGGAGADTMTGGLGDDVYTTDQAGDVIVELAGEGTDWVNASTSHALGANLEKLVLQGSANIDGSGNALSNGIAGNSGVNVLHGGDGADTLEGKAGHDVLFGDAGSDGFVFALHGAADWDTISDYNVAADHIRLEDSVFTGLGVGGSYLSANQFQVGATAADLDDHIIYDPVTGGLYYDPDGVGLMAQSQFAQVAPGLVLTAGEFLLT